MALYNYILSKILSVQNIEAVEVIEAAEILKPGKITTDDPTVIQVLEFSFILMF